LNPISGIHLNFSLNIACGSGVAGA
jgi:hypothetical protein